MKKDDPETWEIGYISAYNGNHGGNPYVQATPIPNNKLQIYYAKNKNDKYELAARFVPIEYKQQAKSEPIKFSNFDNERYQELTALVSNLDKGFGEFVLDIPLYILRGGDEQKGKTAQVVEINKIEKIYEPEELLDILKHFTVITESDYILLRNEECNHYLSLQHPDNIENIREALSSRKSFILQIIHKDNATTSKVTQYRNGSYIQWKGWAPSLNFLCVGMPCLLGINKPKTIFVYLSKEKEKLHHYNRNKWIGRGLMAVILALITYQLKNKIYNAGSLLLN